ncbi:MAG: AEC family transporter [Pseudomonadota bacterium]
MGSVIGLVLPFFGLIALGFITARITRQPIEALGWMNTFIVYVALPALFFNLVAKTPVEELAEFRFIVATTLSTFIIFVVMFAIAIVRTRGEIAPSTIMGLAAAYGNIGYMGPGLALLAFGEAAVVPVALIFCFDNVLHFVMAPLMMALSEDDDEKPPPLQVAFLVFKRIALHPFILATVVGVTAAIVGFRPPDAAQTLLNYLANAAAPCALFAMGVTLALRPLNRMPKEAAIIAPLKLIIAPALLYIIVSWAGDFQPVWIYAAVLLAALPTATNVYVIGQQYGVWVERASAMVLITTVLSVITVTALLYLMTNDLMPPDLFPGG